MESIQHVLAALYFFVPAYVANMAPVIVKGHFAVLVEHGIVNISLNADAVLRTTLQILDVERARLAKSA